MCLKNKAHSLACVKTVVLLFFIVVGVVNPARAALITFDDIPYAPEGPEDEWPVFFAVPLSDEYLSQGLLISGGYLDRRFPLAENLDNPQYLFGGNFMRLKFVGDKLPNYVSMTISSVFDYANVIDFYGPDGHLLEMFTSGSMGAESNDPYQENQPISFTSETGISEITFRGYFNMRWGTLVDDLVFESSPDANVPEPGLLFLFFWGIGVLMLSRTTLRNIFLPLHNVGAVGVKQAEAN